MTNSLTLSKLIDLSQIFHSDKFKDESPFNLLGKNLTHFLHELLDELGVSDTPVLKGEVSPHAVVEGRVYVEKGAIVGPGAYIVGPTYIAAGAEVRHAAFIRGSVYVGPKAVVGHTTEAKGAIFFDGAKAGHFAYVGDSILGRNVNLGAGTKLANLKLKGNHVMVTDLQGERLSSNLRKLGALIGDDAQTGCNAVLSPGTILLPGTAIYPCVHFNGTLMTGHIRA